VGNRAPCALEADDDFVALSRDSRDRGHLLPQTPHRGGEEVTLEVEDEHVRASSLHLLPLSAELPQLLPLHQVPA